MVDVNRAYNQVRRELAEVGLLSEGVYLDHIEVCVSRYPSRGEAGYVFESIGDWGRLGFRPGHLSAERYATNASRSRCDLSRYHTP